MNQPFQGPEATAIRLGRAGRSRLQRKGVLECLVNQPFQEPEVAAALLGRAGRSRLQETGVLECLVNRCFEGKMARPLGGQGCLDAMPESGYSYPEGCRDAGERVPRWGVPLPVGAGGRGWADGQLVETHHPLGAVGGVLLAWDESREPWSGAKWVPWAAE